MFILSSLSTIDLSVPNVFRYLFWPSLIFWVITVIVSGVKLSLYLLYNVPKSYWFLIAQEKTKELIVKLENANVNLKGETSNIISNKLEGKSICITGSFDNYSRDDIVKIIGENSGKAVSSVSKKTNILIAGENAGSKLAKANELGIQVMSIEEFFKIM